MDSASVRCNNGGISVVVNAVVVVGVVVVVVNTCTLFIVA